MTRLTRRLLEVGISFAGGVVIASLLPFSHHDWHDSIADLMLGWGALSAFWLLNRKDFP